MAGKVWVNEMKGTFNRYIGIDYSGAETCSSSLKGLRVYAADHLSDPSEVAPPPGLRRYWTRKGIAEWLVERLSEEPPMLVGIDHGFSFPLQYFEKYDLPHDWTLFLNDFQEHGQQTMTALTLNPCVMAFADMWRLVTVILTGDD